MADSGIFKAGWLPRLFSVPLPKVRPYQEMGTTGTPVYAGYVLSPEKSSALIGQQKYRTFSDIMANTSIAAAGVRYFLNIVARPSWSCEVADAKYGGNIGGKFKSQAEGAAEFVHDVLFEDLETPWSRIIRRCGMYRFHGFSIQEWTAKRRDDGRVGFEDVESRPQWTIWRWEVDEQGTVIGAWQRDPLTGRELGLPRGKILYLVDDTISDNPEGMGLLRHVYDPAERLKEYLDMEAKGFFRDLRGIPIAKAPMSEMANMVKNGVMTQADMTQRLDDFFSFATLEKKGNKTAVMVDSQPYINYTDSGNVVSASPRWQIELMNGASPGLAEVNSSIIRINQEIARILGVEHLLLGADRSGSYALAKEKATDLYLLANSVLRDIRDQVQRDLVDPLWVLNGWDDELKPQLKTEDVSPKDVEQISRVLQQMAASGAMLQPDDEAINFVRDLIGAPQVDLDAMREQMMGSPEQLQQPRQQKVQPVKDDAHAEALDESGGLTGGGGFGGGGGYGKRANGNGQVEKMVPYTEQEPYLHEDSVPRGRTGAPDGHVIVDPNFGPRSRLKPGGIGQSFVNRHGRNEEEGIGDVLTPGSRMNVRGRPRVL